MLIKKGDRIPSASFKTMGKDGPQDINTDDIFKGKKVVLFAVPGAFTPGCSQTHMPGFVVKLDEIKAKGVDTVACTAVNDVFVMDAWQKNQNAEHILMLADGNGDFAESIGLALDLSAGGLGKRSKRYAMIVDDGVVSWIGIDDKGVEQSSADSVLAEL